MTGETALTTCYRLAGQAGHRLDLIGATADARGELTCVGCGATADDLLPHLIAAAAEALHRAGELPAGGAAELIRRAPTFEGTLVELLAVIGDGG